MQLKKKPTGIYFVEYEGEDENGAIGRRRVSLDTRDEREAKNQLRQWAAGKHPKQFTTPQPKRKDPGSPTVPTKGWTVERALTKTLDDVWADKRSYTVNRSNCRALIALCGDELLVKMDGERITKLIREQQALKLAMGTISRRLASLRTAMMQSMDWIDPATGHPYLARLPKWPEITVENRQERVVSYEEEKAIFEAIEKRRVKQPNRKWWHYAALVRLLLDSGLRMGEALLLNKRIIHTSNIIDPKTGHPRLATFIELPRYDTKSKKPRVVPLSAALIDLKPTLETLAVDGKWFPWEPGATTPWQMWNDIRADLAAQGMDLKDVKQHTFRHTCLTRLARGGMGIHRLKEWAGHHDIKITDERYGHLCKEDLIVGLDIQQENYRIAEISSQYSDLPVSLISQPNGVNRAEIGTAH